VTISEPKRKAAITRVLVRLAEKFWDEQRGYFGDADLDGTSPLGTTLDEMKDMRWIELVHFLPGNSQPYALTVRGWSQAQDVAGHFKTDDFADRRGRLCAALKATIKLKGRGDESMVDYREVALAAAVPDGWVWNILESQTLVSLDFDRNYNVRFEGGNVTVPSTFGQLYVRFDDDD
jgi:hypothetical protein